MSTEATGDGRTDAVGAVGSDVTAEETDPADAAAAGAADLVPGQAASPDDAEATDDTAEASDALEPGAPGEGDEPGESGEAVDPGEDEEADEAAAGADDYGDGEGSEDDEGYEDYDEYGPEEVAGPRRARWWSKPLLALGFAVLAAAIVGGAVAIVGSATHGFNKPAKIVYKKSALFSLKTGDCFDPQGQSYSLIPCGSPHDAEVFATFALSGSKWPGTTAIAKDASHGCASRLTGYLNPQLAISLSSTYVYPDPVAWQAGTRTVICEVRATSGDLTGSVRGASATAG